MNAERKANCRALCYNIGKKVSPDAVAWGDTQVVGGRVAQHLPSLGESLAVRLPAGGDVAVWANPAGRLVSSPQNHYATGSVWLDADANGDPVLPQPCRGLPTSFPDADPLGSGGSGVDTICIPYKYTDCVLASKNATVVDTGGGLRFDFSDAVSRWYTPTAAETPTRDATPPFRPFVYPSGPSTPEWDESYLSLVADKLPVPSALNLPNPGGWAGHSVCGMNINGTNWYDLGLAWSYGAGPLCVIPRPPAALGSDFKAHLGYYDTSSGGRWDDPTSEIVAVGNYAVQLLNADGSQDPFCAATWIDWGQYPAQEKRRGWRWTLDPPLQNGEESTVGLPERLFPSQVLDAHLPVGTAIDLVLAFVLYEYVIVTVSRHEKNAPITLDNGIESNIFVRYPARWYSAVQTQPQAWNTLVWGKFRQIVPVAPKARAAAQP